MIRKIVLIGGGGHCLSVIDVLNQNLDYDDIVITDNRANYKFELDSYRVVGDDSMLPGLFEKGYKEAFLTVGSIKSTEIRHNIFERAEKIGYNFPVICDMTASVSPKAKIDRGVFIGKKAIVNTATKIGEHSIINTGAIVEHECSIGRFVHIAVGAVICGGCNIGDDVFVGANTTIINGVNIGKNSIVGAGSIVLSDVPENVTVCGIWRRR